MMDIWSVGVLMLNFLMLVRVRMRYIGWNLLSITMCVVYILVEVAVFVFKSLMAVHMFMLFTEEQHGSYNHYQK